jgi:hypothetical protein
MHDRAADREYLHALSDLRRALARAEGAVVTVRYREAYLSMASSVNGLREFSSLVTESNLFLDFGDQRAGFVHQRRALFLSG